MTKTRQWLSAALIWITLLSVLSPAALAVGAEPRSAEAAETYSGSCGASLTWTLQDGTLTVRGSGNMPDFHMEAPAPWDELREDIRSVVIESGVTGIGNMAFYACPNLRSVSLPGTLRNIRLYAFADCTGLTGLVVPGSVRDISENAFSGCTGLASLTLSNGVASIGPGAFEGCTGLTRLSLPNSVTDIGDRAFADCSRLADVSVSSGLKNLGALPFTNTPWSRAMGDFAVLENVLMEYQGSGGAVTIPSRVTVIGDYAFCGAERLTGVTIPNSVVSIGRWAFGSSGLKKLTVPSGVLFIGSQAFADCRELAEVRLADGVMTIGEEAFWNCVKLSSVAVPGSVTGIGGRAFQDCVRLETVTLANGVTALGEGAFWGCSALRSVSVPDTLDRFDSYAFFNCGSLTDIRILNRSAVFGKDVFFACPDAFVLYGYSGSTAQSYAMENGLSFRKLSDFAAPVLTGAENVQGGVRIRWDKVDGAAKYRVFYKTASGTWKKAGDTAATSFTWSGGSPDTKYSFTVRCVTSDGSS